MKTLRLWTLAATLLVSLSAPARAATDIAADYTIYLGGFLFASGTFHARLDGDSYNLKALLTTAGLPRAFYEATFDLSSEGNFADTAVHPHLYRSVSSEWDHPAKTMRLDYDAQGMPRITATPPIRPGELEVVPYQQLSTQDPISAVLVPVAAGAHPCDRVIPVFDGKRRYDLKLSYAKTMTMTPHGLGRTLEVIACNIRYVAVAPIEKRKFTEMLRRNDSMTVWLAPFDEGRVYMPVRLLLRTPLGGAVAELANVTERTVAPEISDELRYRLPQPRPQN